MDIEFFLNKYIDEDVKAYEEASDLERIGVKLVESISSGSPIDSELALEFVNRVEVWKAMGISERIFGVGKTTNEQAVKAITNAIEANSKKEQIISFHSLIGFGISIDKIYKTRKAKVASAAVRFLFPKDWGVVDWRSGAISQCMIDNDFDIYKAVRSARETERSDWVLLYEHIDADRAIEINNRYLQIGCRFDIQNNADVDIFLFGISLDIWPISSKSANKYLHSDRKKLCLKDSKPFGCV